MSFVGLIKPFEMEKEDLLARACTEGRLRSSIFGIKGVEELLKSEKASLKFQDPEDGEEILLELKGPRVAVYATDLRAPFAFASEASISEDGSEFTLDAVISNKGAGQISGKLPKTNAVAPKLLELFEKAKKNQEMGVPFVNQFLEQEGSPLHCAAFYGHHQLVVSLLDMNADPTIRLMMGQTPCDQCKVGKDPQSWGMSPDMYNPYGEYDKVIKSLEEAEKVWAEAKKG